jgi:hypothetical protein
MHVVLVQGQALLLIDGLLIILGWIDTTIETSWRRTPKENVVERDDPQRERCLYVYSDGILRRYDSLAINLVSNKRIADAGDLLCHHPAASHLAPI